MSKDAVERLREKAQNEATAIELNKLLRLKEDECNRLKQERYELAALAELRRDALKFYASGNHFIRHQDVWESVSGEPENFLEDESNTATVEDGSIAAHALCIAGPAALREIQARTLEDAAEWFDGESYTERDESGAVINFTEDRLREMAAAKRKGE